MRNLLSPFGKRIFPLVVLLGLGPIVNPAAAGSAPDEAYLAAQLRVVRGLGGQLEAMANAADDAATRLVAGGNLYLAGEPGMIAELIGRAGGLCGAKSYPSGKGAPPLGRNDVVIFSDYGPSKPRSAVWSQLVASDALVVAFASAEDPIFQPRLADHVVPLRVDIPRDSRMIARPDGQRLIPTAPPAIATAQWAYVAELIGACRRQHRQPAVYLSIFLDPGRRRLKRTIGLMFEPNLHPEPAARKQYAHEFLGMVRGGLEAIRRDQRPNLAKAATWLREASAGRGKIFRDFMGHLPPVEAGSPGDVSFFANVKPIYAWGEKGIRWIRANLHSGDLFVFLGYQENEDAMAAAANALGARTIFITSKGPGARQAKSPLHLYVNPHWPATDGCLELPGYDVKACPLSAILGLTCYYAICADVVAGQAHSVVVSVR